MLRDIVHNDPLDLYIRMLAYQAESRAEKAFEMANLRSNLHSIFSSVTSSDVHIATKNKYMGISLAGKGCTAETYFAIPQSAVNNTDRTPDAASLRSQVCAVKLYKMHASRVFFNNELPAMKRLQTVTEALRARFVEPLDNSDESGKDNAPSWIAMKAIQGFTLTQFRRAVFLSKKVVPEEFMFHMYVQLHEAVKYLHTSDPPMVKGDIVGVNVMIDTSTQEVPGFPNIKLIDFGSANIGKAGVPLSQQLRDQEWQWVYRLMYDFATLNHKCEYSKDSDLASGGENKRTCSHGVEFTDFIDSLGYALTAGRRLDKSYSEQEINLQERLPRILKIRRNYASPKVIQAIKHLLEETSASIDDKFPSDHKILEVLNRKVLSTPSLL